MSFDKLYLMGYFSARLSDELLFFIIPILIYLVTKDVSKSGLILTFEWAARLCILPFIGLLVDKNGARKLILFADSMRLLVFAILAIVSLLAGNISFISLSILSICLSIIFEISYVSNESFIIENFYSKRFEFQKFTQQIDQIIKIVSPGLAVLIINPLSFSILLFLMIFITSANFIIILIYNPNKIVMRNINTNKCQFFSGFKLIFNNNILLNVCFISIFMNFFYGIVVSTLSFSIIGIFNQDKHCIAVLSIFTAMIITVVLHFSYKKFYTNSNYLLCIIICFGSFLLLGLSRNIYLYYLSFIAFSSSLTLLSLFIRYTRSKIVPSQDLGKVVGAMLFFNSVSIPLAGLVVYLFGSDYLIEIFSLSGIIFLGTLLVTIFMRQPVSKTQGEQKHLYD